jgi:hypothetical protein
MTRDDILRIAKEAGVWVAGQKPYQTQLERFADLILDHLAYEGIHTCHAECQRPACVAIRKRVEAEREACAQLALQGTGEAVQTRTLEILQAERQRIAASIRARGEK